MKIARFNWKNIFFQCLLGLLGISSSWGVYAVGTLKDLGGLNSGTCSQALGVNADGTVVVGAANDGDQGNTERAFIWTSQGMQMRSLGTLYDGTYSKAYGVSADGTVVVGGAQSGSEGNETAFLWTNATGMQDLGVLLTVGGSNYSKATAVSADGKVVVGASGSDQIVHAFRWTCAQGMCDLGTLGGNESGAYGVNADGSVVVGEADGNDGRKHAFRWTQVEGSMVNLEAPNDYFYSAAHAVNANGNVVVGEFIKGATQNIAQASDTEAFLWTQVSGMISLGNLHGGRQAVAYGVSIDGSVVVGRATDGASSEEQRGFRWTQTTGMQTIEKWLGIEEGSIPTVVDAKAVSPDGSVVVGKLATNEAYIARGLSGLLVLSGVDASLNENGLITPMISETGGLILHGANGYPLSKLLTEKEDSCAWMTGDWGSMGSGSRAGLAEVGTCHRFNRHLQANIGIGKNRASHNLSVGGKAILEGNYALVQMLRELSVENLWLTVSGLYQGGKIESRRGYMNAGQPDSSSGVVHTTMPAIRSRLDWNEGLQVKQMLLTPYVELSHLTTKVNAYAENGGGFPAAFDAKKEHITETRLGINGRLPLLANTNLLGSIEGVHRFQKNGVATTGELIGLLNFSIPGQDYQQNWLRGSLGINHYQDHKIASLMIHATTQGQDPKFWVSASYAVKF